MNKSAFQKGLKDGIPIGLGYFAVSFTFGIMVFVTENVLSNNGFRVLNSLEG